MATPHESTLKKGEYKNWLRSSLGLRYLKEGLEKFVTDVIKHQHGQFVANLQPCSSCSLQTLLPHHALKVGRNCSRGRAKCLCIGSKHTVRTPCPINVCGQIYDQIVFSHSFGDPNFSNTDITKWVTDPWELAKCYINAGGYKDKTSAEDTDCLGILSIIINNLEFQGRIESKTIDTCLKVRQYRNDIMHSSDLEVTDANLKTYIEDMVAVLDDPTQLKSDNDAQLARQKLKKLLETEIYISTEDEISIIREAQRSLERNCNIQAESLQEIVQNLDTTKENNQNRFESIEKTHDSLRKAIEDFNNKIGDQQTLISDIQQVKTDLESMKAEAKINQQRITDQISVIEDGIKKIEAMLQKMELEKMQKVKDRRHKEQLEYIEKKTGLETVVAETCPTCGNSVKNPLVEMGIVSDRLSQVLVPPPSAPLQVEKKVSKKKVEKGRVFSSVEMLNELKEKERQELERQKAVEERKKEMEKRREAKAKEAEEKRVRLEKKREERVEKRKREEKEKEERKRIRMERKESKASSSKAKKTADINSQLAALSAAAYMCGVCGARGTVRDEENGVQWFGCDSCDRWFHDACLSPDEILSVRTSLTENSFWNCKFCSQTVYEE